MVELSGAQLHQLVSETDLKALIRRLAQGAPVSWWQTTASQNPPKQDSANPVSLPDPSHNKYKPQETSASNPAKPASLPDPSQRNLAVTVAQCAVAETGSVIFLEDNRAAMLHSLLCEKLLVLIRNSQIMASLGDTSKIIVEAAHNHQQVTFLTGPSRTGDIELHHVNGIQGPYEVHIAICDFPLTPK